MNTRAGLPHAVAATMLCGLLAACGSGNPDQLLASAKEYLAKNDPKAAIIQLKNALEKKPDLAEARFLLGRTELATGDVASAEKELRRARELKYPAAQVDPPLAVAWVRMGEYQKVIDEFSTVQGATPRDTAEIRTAVGQAQLALGKPDLAKAAFDTAQKADPGYALAMVGEARLLAQQRDLAGALTQVEKAIVADPTSADAWQFKAGLLFARQQYDQAIAAYRKVVAINPGYLPAHWGLIAALVHQGNAAEADKALTALQKIAPKHPQTYYLEALVRSQQGKYAAARDAIQLQLARVPDSAEGNLLAAGIAYQLHDYDRAESGLVKILQRAPGNEFARRLLVGTYIRTRQPAKALDTMKPLLGRIDHDAMMQSVAGEVYLLNGDPAEAAGYFERAAQLDPKGARQMAGLALTRLAQGDTTGGVKDLEAAAAIDTSTRSDLMLIAVAMRRQHWDEALQAIDSLEKKQPDKPLAANLRGLALLGKHDAADARKSFEHALQIDPGYFPATANLARLDIAEKKPEEAQKRFEALIAKDPKNSQAMLALADVRAREKAPSSEVLDLINKAVAASPNEVRPRLALMQYYMRAKDPKRAVSAGQDALVAIPGRPELLDALGQAQQAAGDSSQALTTFGRYAEVAPDSPVPYLRMAAVQGMSGNYDAAAQSFRRALVIKPDLIEAQKGLTEIDLAKGRVPEALARAKEMQKQRPKEAIGYIFEGDIHARKKDWPNAIAAYHAGTSLMGASEAAIKEHAAMVASGQAAQANKMSAAWLRTHPDDDRFILSLAELAGQHKDYPTAIKYYQQLLAKQPDNALLLNNLAWVAGKVNDPKALSYAEKANKLAPNQAAILDTLGTLLVQHGDTTRGLAAMGQATELAPQVPAIRLNYARALVKSGQKADAKQQLDELAKLGTKFSGHDEVAQLQKEL